MNMKMKVINFLWFVFCLVPPVLAQQGLVACGGDISNSNGSVAYSVGQVTIESISNETGSINQGLQQPFQLNIVGISDLHWNSIQLFPNPANQNLYMQLTNIESKIQAGDFSVRVYDMQGKLLFTQRLHEEVNSISISELPAAIYFIQVWNSTVLTQSFSFSKTN